MRTKQAPPAWLGRQWQQAGPPQRGWDDSGSGGQVEPSFRAIPRFVFAFHFCFVGRLKGWDGLDLHLVVCMQPPLQTSSYAK